MITLSPSESSLLKGESVEDTVRNIQGYCDIMVMRHPTPGQVTTAARLVIVISSLLNPLKPC